MMISGPPRSLQIPVCVQSGYALWYGLFHLSPLRYVELQCSIVFHLLRIPVLFQLRRVFFRIVLRADMHWGMVPFVSALCITPNYSAIAYSTCFESSLCSSFDVSENVFFYLHRACFYRPALGIYDD